MQSLFDFAKCVRIKNPRASGRHHGFSTLSTSLPQTASLPSEPGLDLRILPDPKLPVDGSDLSWNLSASRAECHLLLELIQHVNGQQGQNGGTVRACQAKQG